MVFIEIGNRNLWFLFEVSGERIYVTETMLATWVVMAVLIIFGFIVKSKLQSFQEVPVSKFQNVVEFLVEALNNLSEDVLGEDLRHLGGYFFGVFMFVLASNYAGIVGLRPPTSDLTTTLPLALTTFILIHYVGISRQKFGYIKGYFAPFFLFMPLNVMGELAKPISLCFRLFGNILGGMILLQLCYMMLGMFAFVFPAVPHIMFDFFGGALQSYIFIMLSMTFIKGMA